MVVIEKIENITVKIKVIIEQIKNKGVFFFR